MGAPSLVPGLKLAAEFSPYYTGEFFENTQFSLGGNDNDGKQYHANGYGAKLQAYWEIGTEGKSWAERPLGTWLLAVGAKYRYRDLEAINPNLGGGDGDFASHQIGVEADATYYIQKMIGIQVALGGGALLWRGTMDPGVAALYQFTGDDQRNHGYFNVAAGLVFRPIEYLSLSAKWEYTLPLGALRVTDVETKTDFEINGGGGSHALVIGIEGYLNIF